MGVIARLAFPMPWQLVDWQFPLMKMVRHSLRSKKLRGIPMATWPINEIDLPNLLVFVTPDLCYNRNRVKKADLFEAKKPSLTIFMENPVTLPRSFCFRGAEVLLLSEVLLLANHVSRLCPHKKQC